MFKGFKSLVAVDLKDDNSPTSYRHTVHNVTDIVNIYYFTRPQLNSMNVLMIVRGSRSQLISRNLLITIKLTISDDQTKLNQKYVIPSTRYQGIIRKVYRCGGHLSESDSIVKSILGCVAPFRLFVFCGFSLK